MRFLKALRDKAVANLFKKAEDCLDLSKTQHGIAEKQHEDAIRQPENAARQHKSADELATSADDLERLAHVLENDAIELQGESELMTNRASGRIQMSRNSPELDAGPRKPAKVI